MSKELDGARALVKMLEEKESENKVLLSSLNPGEKIQLDKYKFVVLEQKDGQTVLISDGLMAENKKFDSKTRDYNKSSLKEYIESKIQPTIENAVGVENLIEHVVDLTAVTGQNEFGECICKVRPLSFTEAVKYNDLLENSRLSDWYWTLTPWTKKSRGYDTICAVVSPSGFVSGDICIGNRGVRPVCILKSNIYVSKGE